MLSGTTILAIGAVFNLLVAVLIVRFIYYPVTQDKSYVFTYLMFNTVIYFVLGLLTNTTLSVGVGFGLFAIFSVLRYRTDEIPIREMTYLFVIIALPVINSVMVTSGNFAGLIVANAIIMVLLFVLEKGWGFHFSDSKRLIYDRIDLITPANHDLLLADLRERTGLPIVHVEIESLDFLHDTAELIVHHDEVDLVTLS